MNRKIAIPTAGSEVNAHFGRSQAFTIFEITDGKVTGEEMIETRGLEHQHAGIAQLLKSKGVQTVICGGIGPGAIAGLENAGLEVLKGANGKVREVAKEYAEGRFEPADAVCEHPHGHDHHHHHHHLH